MENMRDDSMENKIEDAYLDEGVDSIEEINSLVDDEVSEVPNDMDTPIEEVPQEDTKKHKKKKKKDKKSKVATDDTDTALDNVDDAQGGEDTTPTKVKKPLKKGQKIAIIVISIVLAVAIIATSITVPLVLIANKGKIFVSTAEDFANTEGDTYVLKDDISIDGDLTLGNVNNITLNGKTLTVTGSLIINNESEGNVLLGQNDGTINAGTVKISSSAPVIIKSLMKVSDMNVVAPSIVIDDGINVSEKVILSADEIAIYKKFEFANAERQDMLNILDSKSVLIEGEISGNVSITNPNNSIADGYASNVSVLGGILGDIYADKDTLLTISSKVTGKVDSSDTTTVNGVTTVNNKIGKVKLNESSFVKTILNASIVYVHQDAIFPNMINVDRVDTIRKLARVGYIAIDDSTEDIILSFGAVKGAYQYEIVIDGDRENRILINAVAGSGALSTSLKDKGLDDASKHIIEVRAIAKDGDELLLNSDPLTYEYMTYTTLTKAQNIKIAPDENGVMQLTFDAVPFAEEYIITVNGREIVTSETSIDVTSYLTDGGAYVVSIIATSSNDNILRSKPSMYQYDHEVKLASPEFNITNVGDRIVFKWTSVAHASQYYLIEVEGGTETIVFRTASNEFDIPKSNKMANKIYKIRAIGENGYYLDSESIQITYQG